MSQRLHVRRFSLTDDLHALTELIHAAYAPHASSGLRYWATHQSVRQHRKRISRGVCLVGELEARSSEPLLARPDPESKVDLRVSQIHGPSGNLRCCQFTGQRALVGNSDDPAALRGGSNAGCRVMALHTAQPAAALIKMYSPGATPASARDWRPRQLPQCPHVAGGRASHGSYQRPPNPSLHPTASSGLRPLPSAGELQR
jgi:hypothetical protein